MSSPGILPDGMMVAVTGANGFIGSRFIEMLAITHPSVRVRRLSRRRQRAEHRFIKSLDDPTAVAEALRGCRALVHCAFDFQDVATNLTIAQVIGRACIAAGIRLVHVSTAAVYEPLPNGFLDENDTTAKVGSAYKMVKAAIEIELIGLASKEGLDLIILQPTTVYGPYGRAWTDSPVRELLTGTVMLPAKGEGLCNAVYIDDVCRAIIAGLKVLTPAPSASRILISGPQPIVWKEFYGAYQEMLRLDALAFMDNEDLNQASCLTRKPQQETGSSSLLQQAKYHTTTFLGARRATQLNAFLEILKATVMQRQIHKPSGAKLALFQSRCHIRIDKARALLGYEPEFDLKLGMAMTAPYVRNSYGLFASLRRRVRRRS